MTDIWLLVIGVLLAAVIVTTFGPPLWDRRWP